MKDQTKELERIAKMLDEAQTSLTNCTSTADRKNEAAVIKELYAALKNVNDIILQDEKDRNEEKLKKEAMEKDEAIKIEANKIDRERLEIERKKQANQEYVDHTNLDRDYQRLMNEERQILADQQRNTIELKWRKYQLGMDALKGVLGLAAFFSACGVAAVATNEGIYDNSLSRTAGLIPQKMLENFIRK